MRLGCYDPPEGRKIVASVVVHGNDVLSDGDIEERLYTHSDNFTFGPKPLLDRADLASDAQRIQSLYATHGYFEARVTKYRVEPMGPEAVRAHFTVDEGEPTLVRTLQVLGMEESPEPEEPRAPEAKSPEPLEPSDRGERLARLERVREDLRDLVTLEVDEPWSQDAHGLTKKALEEALRDEGFIYAEVLGEVVVDREAHAADVTYRAVPGPLARVEAVEVVGHDHISAERILRRVHIEAGDVAERDPMDAAEHDLQRLGVFFAVSAEPVRPGLGEKLGARPRTVEVLQQVEWEPTVTVRVSVQEMPMREWRTGVGASIDNVRSDVHVMGGFKHRDLFGSQRHLDLDVVPAWSVLPTFFEPTESGPAGKAKAEFRQPAFLEEYLELFLRGEYEMEVNLGYRSHDVRSEIALAREFFQALHVKLGYNVLWTRFFDFSGALDLEIDETLGLAFQERYLLTYLEEALTLDLRDSRFDPRRGFYAQARVQEGFRAIGSDFQYLRILGDVRLYWTPFDFITFAARGVYGRILPIVGEEARVPLPVRFFGGGASDHRGFGARTMGPEICEVETEEDVCSDRAFVGGNVKALGSFETRWYLPANFGLVAFVDVGQVWARREDVTMSSLEVAVGPGFRYYTPFGPVRLDLGFLLTTPQPPELSFHFSIGQSF
ncbi:MAG: BamA/OMP85 family outer membrane protein [Myxococcota bacterium]